MKKRLDELKKHQHVFCKTSLGFYQNISMFLIVHF